MSKTNSKASKMIYFLCWFLFQFARALNNNNGVMPLLTRNNSQWFYKKYTTKSSRIDSTNISNNDMDCDKNDFKKKENKGDIFSTLYSKPFFVRSLHFILLFLMEVLVFCFIIGIVKEFR